MTLKLEAISVPLRRDESGAYRVGNSQVLLDVLVREFNRGGDPESIARAYSTLELADVYAVVAYYLGHRPEVDALIRTRAQAAERLREADRGHATGSGRYPGDPASSTGSQGTGTCCA